MVAPASSAVGGRIRLRIQQTKPPIPRANQDDTQAALRLVDWVQAHRVIDAKPFSFEGHEYLRGIYEDEAPHIVLRKGSQLGASEYAITKGLWCLDRAELVEHRQRNVIYFFPTDGNVREFSAGRVTPAIASSPYLSKVMARPNARNEGLAGGTVHWRYMHNGRQGLVFRGMRTGLAVKSVPADLVIFDELDEAIPEARSQAEERMAHSDLHWIVDLSTPTIPGYGIEVEWEHSDRRQWFVDCACEGGCSPDLTWPDCLAWDGARAFLRCPECGESLDVNRGHWRPTASSETHGYHVSQLIAPYARLQDIANRYRNQDHLRRLHNHNLGVPYTCGRVPLPRDVVLACVDERPFEEAPAGSAYFMGVDVGDLLHVAIGHWVGMALEITHLAALGSWTELMSLTQRFRPHCAVIDAQPEGHTTRAFVAQLPGRAYRATYVNNSNEAVAWKPEEQRVIIERTESLDALKARFRQRGVRLPGGIGGDGNASEETVREFVSHCGKLTYDVVENAVGKQEARYGNTGPDHYAHAANYLLVAADQRGLVVEETVYLDDVLGDLDMPMLGAGRL